MGSVQATTECIIPPFPGRQTASEGIGCERIDTAKSTLNLTEDQIGTAWFLTLYLYSRLALIAFQSTDAKGCTTIRASEIDEEQTLESVTEALKIARSPNGASSNIAITFHAPSDGAQESHSCLERDIDVSLCNISTSPWTLHFRHSFMEPGEAQNLAATFSHILHHQARRQGPGRQPTIHDITSQALSPQDAAQVLTWNSSPLQTASSLLHEAFSRVAAQQPQAVAIDAWDGTMTYGELDAASSALAARLRRHHGVGPGGWVLFCFAKSRRAIIAMLGVLKAGAAFAPVDGKVPVRRVKQVMELTGARWAVVGDEEAAETVRRAGVVAGDIVVVGDNDNDKDEQHLPSTEEMGAAAQSGAKESLGPQSPAIALFTSGSTGVPKGILTPHAALCTAAWAYGKGAGVSQPDPKERFLQFA